MKKPEKNSGIQRGLNPWPRDTGGMLYQLSYEATDIGSRSIIIVGSYVLVKEMSVDDIWNKSYMNCGNEMKMKKWLFHHFISAVHTWFISYIINMFGFVGSDHKVQQNCIVVYYFNSDDLLCIYYLIT